MTAGTSRWGAALRVGVYDTAPEALMRAGVSPALTASLAVTLEASRETREALGFGATITEIIHQSLPLWRIDDAGADYIAIAAVPGTRGFAVWLAPTHFHRESEDEAEALAVQCQKAAAHLPWCVLCIRSAGAAVSNPALH